METEGLIFVDDKGVEYAVSKVGEMGGRPVAWMKGRKGFVPLNQVFKKELSAPNAEGA